LLHHIFAVAGTLRVPLSQPQKRRQPGTLYAMPKLSYKISDFNSWYIFWKNLGQKAENEKRYLHAAYYFRLAEFFLNDSVEKNEMPQFKKEEQ
jgi:hypothetical protein